MMGLGSGWRMRLESHHTGVKIQWPWVGGLGRESCLYMGPSREGKRNTD